MFCTAPHDTGQAYVSRVIGSFFWNLRAGQNSFRTQFDRSGAQDTPWGRRFVGTLSPTDSRFPQRQRVVIYPHKADCSAYLATMCRVLCQRKLRCRGVFFR